MDTYLTEERLGIFLHSHFKDVNIVKNQKVVNSGSKCRPDFQIPTKKLIVEFDGYNHYNNSKTITRDYQKDKIYSSLGYTIIRFPYFVQLSDKTLSKSFETSLPVIQSYPHGFIDNKALLPADFNDLGIERFLKDLVKFDCIYDDIIKSIVCKIEILGVECVLPKRLEYLVKDFIY
jgi:very-short-patch-repair endonuclease